MQQRVMEILACFRLDAIPLQAIQWVLERRNLTGQARQDGREHAQATGATRLLRSTASEQAFENLLKQGFTVDGMVLSTTSSALADVAKHLVLQGKENVVLKLIDVVVGADESHHRIAATNALAQVSSFAKFQISEQWETLKPLLYDEKRTPYEIGLIISIMDKLEHFTLSEPLLTDLKAWAKNPDRWEGGNALNILAELGHLHEDPDLLTQAIGLKLSGDKWDWVEDAQRPEWAPYTLGILYYHHPTVFTLAIATLIKSSHWQLVSQVIGWLYHAHKITSAVPFPHELCDAFIERIKRFQTYTYAETEIFRVLADLAPERFIDEPWEKYWDNWLPDSRESIASSLGRIAASDSNRVNNVIQKLQLLAGDSEFRVRRASYRSIARQSMNDLYRLCVAWSEEKAMPGLRERAAEALGWLELTVDGRDHFEELFQTLSIDPEKRVRETAKRVNDERKKREWAKHCLSLIIQTKGLENEDILRTWPYARALTKIGDDECIAKLEEHLQRGELPPHLRYWLYRILGQMRQNWQAMVRKWPEPWFAWEGMVERGQGKAHFQDKAIEISYSVWYQPAGEPSKTNRWEGYFGPYQVTC